MPLDIQLNMDDRSSGCLHPQASIMCNTSVFSILRSSRDMYKVRIQVLDFISLLSPPFLFHCRTCISSPSRLRSLYWFTDI
ncbi:hypothetical protein P692DRAFT_20103655 [Suillus brevipes Sb2]|nr:hypothetical protein P692DRAFT_20103655 [Suillus brevipes Sb2]